MAESLFTSQTPASADANDGTAYTLGTVITVAVDGQVTHGRWLFPGTLPSGSVQWVLYDNDSHTELGRATFTNPTAGAWNTVPLDEPVSVSAGQSVVAAVYTPNRYVATNGFFASSGVTNGNLTAPASADDPEGIGNGRFVTFTDTYPASAGGCYFADLVFTAANTLTASASGASTSSGSAAAAARLVASASGGSTSSGSASADPIGEPSKATSTPAVTAGAVSSPSATARRTSSSEVSHG